MKLGEELFDVEHIHDPDHQIYTLRHQGKDIVDRWPEFERKLLGVIWQNTTPKLDSNKNYQVLSREAAQNGMALTERMADPQLSKLFYDGMLQSDIRRALITYIEHVIRGPWPEAEALLRETNQFSYYKMILGLDKDLKPMSPEILNKNQEITSRAWDWRLTDKFIQAESAEVLWIKHDKGAWIKGLGRERIAILLGRESNQIHEIHSPREGILKRVFKRAGQVVEPGSRIFRLDLSDASFAKLPPDIRPVG